MLKYALLGFLNYGSMTGYQLKQFMDDSTCNFWNAKISQIYTTLKSLEETEMVTSRIQPQEERPDKRVYTITEKGRSDFQQWLAEPETHVPQLKDGFLLKFFFSSRLDKETILSQLRLQKKLHQRQADFYRTETRSMLKRILEQNPVTQKDATLWEAARRAGEIFEEAYVNWLNETIQMVEEK